MRLLIISLIHFRHQGTTMATDRAPSAGSSSLKYSQSLKDPTKDPKVREKIFYLYIFYVIEIL